MRTDPATSTQRPPAFEVVEALAGGFDLTADKLEERDGRKPTET
jgi:hypothetical protein